MTNTDCELLTLSIQNLQQMRCEFLDAYENIFQDSILKMRLVLQLKVKAIQYCNEIEREINENDNYQERKLPEDSNDGSTNRGC